MTWDCTHCVTTDGEQSARIMCFPCFERVNATIDSQTAKIKEQGLEIDRLNTLLGVSELQVSQLQAELDAVKPVE